MGKAKQQVSMNVDELKQMLTHIIKNNQHIQQKMGKTPISAEIVGESGIGKTSLVIQLAKELNIPNFVKLNLAQIEELGDLVGFPIRQFEVKKDDSTLFVDEPVLMEYVNQGYTATGKNQMGYCPPHWIANAKDGGGILFLDDWNRADVRFIQAVMELVDRQQYISWSLPKNWHVLLSSNPDDGDYLVNSIDPAQRTRFISINLKFDVKCWGRWAEGNDIDSRCINFLMMHPEYVTAKNGANARSAVMFFNSLTSIPDFQNELALVQNIGEGSVGPEFTSHFTQFIHNKLDKILPPNEVIFNPDTRWVIEEIDKVVNQGGNYRADIASVIATRIMNYSILYAKNNNIEKNFTDRLVALVKSKVFKNDICYQVVKQIFNSDTAKFRSITMDKELGAYILQ